MKLRRIVPDFGSGWSPHEAFGPISSGVAPSPFSTPAPFWVYYPPTFAGIIKRWVQANYVPISQIEVAFTASGTVVWTDSGSGTVPTITTTVTIAKSWSHVLTQVANVDPSTAAADDTFQMVSILGTTLLLEFSSGDATSSVQSISSYATQGGATADFDIELASLQFERVDEERPGPDNQTPFRFDVVQSRSNTVVTGGNSTMLNLAAATSVLQSADRGTTQGADAHAPAGAYTTQSSWNDSTPATPDRGTYDRSATLFCTVTVTA